MIERIYVHNYRCFENFTLDLKGKRSALILGRNGSGKSTLRQALAVLQEVCRGSGRMRDVVDQSAFSHGRLEVPMRFEVDVQLGSRLMEYKLTLEFSERFRDVRVAEEWLAVNGGVVFTRVGAAVTLRRGEGFTFDTPGALLPLITFPYEREAVQQFKAYLASLVLVAPVPSLMSGYSDAETLELSQSADNFGGWLNANLIRSPSRYTDIASYLSAVFHDFGSFEFVSLGERGRNLRVYFEPVGTGEVTPPPIDFRLLSDGEKCLFLSAAITAFNRRDNPLFCFWDEPDNHLSLPEVGQFITELRKSTSQHGQFIATSHHPEAIRRFSDENTFVFTRNSHLEPTVVRPLTELPYGGDLVRALVRGEVI